MVEKIQEAHILARENSEKAQERMKINLDRRAAAREFEPGGLALIFRSCIQFLTSAWV